jgi:hypothetical protein
MNRMGFPAPPATIGARAGRKRPTIGLSEIDSDARFSDATRAVTWRTGKLKVWEPARLLA